MGLPDRIKQYRKGKNMTQKQLAEELFVSRKTVSGWETGHRYPDFNSLVKMSEIFGISLDDLVKGDKKVVDQPSEQDEQPKKGESIERVTYYLNILLLLLSYVHMFRPFGIDIPLITFVLIINMIIFFSHYSNWNSFKKRNKILGVTAVFIILIFLNVLALAFNFSFQSRLPSDTIGIVGATAGEFSLILFIVISWVLAIYFFPSKNK